MPRPPAQWTQEELEADRKIAAAEFNRRRREERQVIDEAIKLHAPEYRSDAVALLEATNNLREITGESLSKRHVMRAARFSAIPFISDDDLDTLTGAKLKSWMGQKTDKGKTPSDEDLAAAAEIFTQALDTSRAPWVPEDRDPTPLEIEVFLGATVAVRLNSRLSTLRRNSGSKRQEEAVRKAIQAAGYQMVSPPQRLTDIETDMEPATYASAPRSLSNASVDVPIRLKVSHSTGLSFLALEAKDSNSEVNSRKRLIEVMEKADTWNGSGLPFQFRTGAVLSGVLGLDRLLEAQRKGVLIFWEHRLQDLTDFLQGL